MTYVYFPPVEEYDDFEKYREDFWYSMGGQALANSELGQNGQFDEIPYSLWEEYHEIE